MRTDIFVKTTILFVLFCNATILSSSISQCVNENELFSLCTWKCPPTCVNLRLLWYGNISCPDPFECRSGCKCKPGYIKDEYSKDCVLVQHCPVASIIVIESAPINVKDGQAEIPVPHLRRVHKVKRSNAAFSYPTPCAAARANAAAAAASSTVPVIAPPMGYHFLSDERYANPYAYELPHYREEQEPETLQFSDMDQMMTRNIPTHYYPTSRGYQPYHQYAGISSMPSLAVFPGTEGKNGCGGVPLLFSCSPSIVQGQLGHAQPYYNYHEQVPVHGHPEYHYALEEPLSYRQVAPEFIDEDRNMNLRSQQLSMTQHLQAINQQDLHQQALRQQALQQQTLQQQALNQQALLQQHAEHEQLINQQQQATSLQINDKSVEQTHKVEPKQELPLKL